MSAIETQAVPDERLARALTAGENAAFDELYRRYARRLSAYGARLLGDASAGEDVAQTALLNAYQALCRGAEPVQVRAWLFRIAHNAALEILSRRRELVEFDEEHYRSGDPHEAFAARGELLSALGTLPERQRAAYLLREVRGLRMVEIGERLGLSQQQVEQALFAARNRLAEQLAFGERLDCETARDLRGAELQRATRRALKRHLRSCVPCRAESARSRRLGLVGALAALRDLAAWLAGAGGVPAAKVGAVAAAAALTVGTPVLGGSLSSDDAPPPAPRPAALLPAPHIDLPATPRPARKPKPRPPAPPAAAIQATRAPVAVASPPAPAEPAAPAEQPVDETPAPAAASEGQVPAAQEPEESAAAFVEEELPLDEELPVEAEAEPAPAEPVDAYAEEPSAGEESDGGEDSGGGGEQVVVPVESAVTPTAVEASALSAQLSP